MTSGSPQRARLAAMFKALGDPTRLKIFEFLATCCSPVSVEASGEVRALHGPTAGEVCCHVTGVEKITSTVSFHLKELRNSGLILMDRRGKNMVCAVSNEAVDMLDQFVSAAKAGPCRTAHGDAAPVGAAVSD